MKLQGKKTPDWVNLMRLLVITPVAGGPGRGHRDVAAAALRAGCRAVQLRDKEMSDRWFAGLARAIMEDCGSAGALFLLNDRVDVAAAIGCDGVHLGLDDLDVADARRILGPGMILGYSPEDLDGARAAVGSGADYLGVGPVFATPSKGDAGGPIGPEGVARYCSEGIAPVVAVGGINDGNAAQAIAAGAAGVAVVSAVASAPDMEAAARAILESVSGGGTEAAR